MAYTSVDERQAEQELMLVQGIQFVDKFINKNYMIGLDIFPVVKPTCDIETYNGLRFYHLKKIIFDLEDDVNDLLVSVFSALHSIAATAIVAIDAKPNHVDFYMGISSDRDSAIAGQVLEKGIKGNFLGSDVRNLRMSDLKAIIKKMTCASNGTSEKNIASVAIVPTLRNEENEFVQGIEKLIDALKGESYTALFISEPVSQNAIEGRKKGFEQLYTTLSPFAKTSLAYGDNISNAVTEGTCANFSHSVNSSISDTNTEGTSKTKGKSQGYSHGTSWGSSSGSSSSDGMGGSSSSGSNFGSNSSWNSSTSSSFSTNASWSRAVTQGTSDTESTGTNKSQTDTLGNSRTLTINYENKTVSNLLEHITQHLNRIKLNEIYGWWMSGAYFLADDVQTAVVAANTYRSLVAGDTSGVENAFVNVWDAVSNKKSVSQMMKYLQCGKHPVFDLPPIGQFDAQQVKPVQLVSGKEIPIFSGLPRDSVPGVVVDNIASFGQEVLTISGNTIDADFPIGKVVHKGSVEDSVVHLHPEAFRSHCFVTGSTGSGKSNTVYRLLENFIQRDIKFMVVEPAKGEYKYEFGNLKGINIFWTNPNTYPMLHINPFSFPDNIHVLEHLDRLIEIFSACWPLYAAMPAILKKSVERVYMHCGWDLIRSIHYPRDNGIPKFPTFAHLMQILPQVINESSYSAESKGNYTGALVTRVESLANGIMGQVFCSSTELSDETLFDSNTIIDLSRVGSSETKSLLMGVMVMKLNEHRMTTATGENVPLKHITILEEAHNLLRNSHGMSSGGEGGNAMGKSVEMISNSIAEMRTYGEGFIIVDQSPTAVDISAIKNTNTKIVMRLPEKNDQETVGNAFSLTPEQIREISRLDVGMAVIGQNGWLQPVLTKIDAASNEYYGREATATSDRDRKLMLGNIVVQLYNQYKNASYNRNKLIRTIKNSNLSERKKKEYIHMISAFVEASKADTDNSYSELCRFIVELLEMKGIFGTFLLRVQGTDQLTPKDKEKIENWKRLLKSNMDKYVLFTVNEDVLENTEFDLASANMTMDTISLEIKNNMLDQIRTEVINSLIHYRAFYDNIGSFKRIEAYFSELSLKAGKV